MLLLAVIISLLAILFIAWGFYLLHKAEAGPAPVEAEEIDLSVYLTKEDYDFLVENGMKRDPELDRKFNPPVIIQRGQIVTNNPEFNAKLAEESRIGREKQEAAYAAQGYRKSELELEARKPELIAVEQAIKDKYANAGNVVMASVIKTGEPKPVTHYDKPVIHYDPIRRVYYT